MIVRHSNNEYMSFERHAGLVELDCLGSIVCAAADYLVATPPHIDCSYVIESIADMYMRFLELGGKLS